MITKIQPQDRLYHFTNGSSVGIKDITGIETRGDTVWFHRDLDPKHITVVHLKHVTTCRVNIA